jgi:hypothetical protein
MTFQTERIETNFYTNLCGHVSKNKTVCGTLNITQVLPNFLHVNAQMRNLTKQKTRQGLKPFLEIVLTRLLIIISTFCILGCKSQTDPASLIFTALTSGTSNVGDHLTKLNFHKGYMVTNTSDTIEGILRLTSSKKPDAITLKNVDDESSIKIQTLSMIRLLDHDSTLTDSNFTDFIRFEKYPKRFYRLIYSGSFKIYDNNYFITEKVGSIGDQLIIVDPNKPGIQTMTLNIKNKLIQFINTRYNKSFKTTDFHDKLDVINWLKQNDK